jgi:hypothetical protein
VDYDDEDGLVSSAPRVFDDAGTAAEINEWLELAGQSTSARAALVQAGRLGRLTLAEYVELLGAGPASELAFRCAGSQESLPAAPPLRSPNRRPPRSAAEGAG